MTALGRIIVKAHSEQEWDNDNSLTFEDFLNLLHPEWHKRAACRAMAYYADEPDFYREGDGGRYVEARKVCATCTVTAECLAEADSYGMRGGLSERQRRSARTMAGRGKQPVPDGQHGTRATYVNYGCRCQLCSAASSAYRRRSAA